MKKLSDYNLNTFNRTYVVAEIGINHGGSLSRAFELVDSACKTGCDAVKFQSYISEKRTSKKEFPDLYEILKKCELKLEDFNELKKLCDEKNIDFISTCFDEESIDYLNEINMKIFKISSFDLINEKLIHKIASLGKTNIVSVGMGKKEEIEKAISILSNNRNNKNIILHCISSYPTKEQDANLIEINNLKDKFHNCIIGHSDHTNDIKVPCYAVAAGAQVIEKHFKINDNMECIDSEVSITQTQMTKLVEEIRKIEIIFGSGKKRLTEQEKQVIKYRRRDIL